MKGIERDVGCRFIEVRLPKSVMLLHFDVLYSYFPMLFMMALMNVNLSWRKELYAQEHYKSITAV